MPIDIHTETVVSLAEATKILPKVNGKRPAISTLWRWCRKGLRGVRLEYLRVGRNIVTSREALNRFFTALADADEPIEPSRPELVRRRGGSSPRRQASLEAADAVIKRAGI